MQSDIKVVNPRCDAIRDLVAQCFNGYKIPAPSDDMITMWIGHVLKGFIGASAAGLTFYRDQPEFAGLHTGCVHPDFRGHGFHVELIRGRMEMAVAAGKSKIIVNAHCPLSRSHLMAEGFVDNKDGGTGDLIWTVA